MKTIVTEIATKEYNPNIVKINYEQIKNTNFNIKKTYVFFNKKNNIPIKDWKQNIYYILGQQSINFQYWNLDENNNYVRYTNGDDYGAVAAYKGYDKLFQEIITGKKITDFTFSDLISFFGNIPNLTGRYQNLKESLNIVNFELAYAVLESDMANNQLVDSNTAKKIAEIMPESFGDPYLKKIQLAFFEIFELMKIKYPRLQLDVTVAADYQIPKVLNGLSILEYSNGLKNKIRNHIILYEGSEEEKAIRSASILACEEISKYHNIPIPLLDKYLWEERNKFTENFHLTITKRY